MKMWYVVAVLSMLACAGMSYADDRYKDLPNLKAIIHDLDISDDLVPYRYCATNGYVREHQILNLSGEAFFYIERFDDCFTTEIKKQQAQYQPKSKGDVYTDEYIHCLEVGELRQRALCYATALREKVDSIRKQLESYEAEFGLWEIETITDRMTDEEMIVATLESAPENGFTAVLKVYCEVKSPKRNVEVSLGVGNTHDAFFLLEAKSVHHEVTEKTGITRDIYVNGRFDEEERELFDLNDIGHEWLVFHNGFVKKMQRANRFLIQIDQSVYDFDTRKAQAALEPLKEKCSVPPTS